MTHIRFRGTTPAYRNFIEFIEEKYHISKGSRIYEKGHICIDLDLTERIL